MEAIDVIQQIRIVPVVVLKRVEDTLPTLGSMLSGGLPIAEITFRSACAADAIRIGAITYPDMIIGAGTVLNAEQAKLAIQSGASFVVSPGLSVEIAKICREYGIPYIPGCVTPTEIMAALAEDLRIIKFFPAEAFGGISAIQSISAAFPTVQFLPTGGICEENMRNYLAFPKVIACGGSFMMTGNYDQIASNCKRAVNLANSVYPR